MKDSRARTRRMMLTSALAATGLLGLSACAPLLVGGAMIGGTLMFADRRTSGTQVEDQSIELKALRRLAENFGDRIHVNVTSYNRLVLLTGEVPSEADKEMVEQAVRRVDNVRSIVNELAVMPVSTLGSRSNDALLSGRVKASLIEAKDLMAQSFKVVTERRTVHLMGIVTEREAARAADIASRVSGVHKVVRVFDIVSEAELAEIRPKEPK